MAVTIGCYIASACAYFLERESMALELRRYIKKISTEVLSQNHSLFVFEFSIYLLFVVVSFFGLYFFWRPARYFYCAFLVISVMPSPFFGPHIEPEWTAFWTDCYKTFSGAILVVIFTSPAKELFSGKAVVKGGA